MEEYTGFSAHASLATIGLWMKERRIWQKVEAQVSIKQKTIRHMQHEKLKDAFVNILAAGQGIKLICHLWQESAISHYKKIPQAQPCGINI